jgi:hypothetical protein
VIPDCGSSAATIIASSRFSGAARRAGSSRRLPRRGDEVADRDADRRDAVVELAVGGRSSSSATSAAAT